MLDSNTFGDSPAAIVLAKIINERNLKYKKIAKLLNDFNKTIGDINHVDTTTSIFLMGLIYRNSIDKCNSFDEPLNTYTKNVLSTIYKKWAVRKNAYKPKKNRNEKE
jgi:hypothetical protein